ncbi:N-acetylmuramoyl-L-alanine amidase [Umezawaea tangerina]|uniref:N-acetylmuramoyl-L-alanine amidase n=1 Tax=Umezawaea tangerina TaxID=84725 RepID=A0A2T0TK87_9PSEU|nr:N-acetylmuramoyl-L-alanine amidase [Umezawaea tangerina]
MVVTVVGLLLAGCGSEAPAATRAPLLDPIPSVDIPAATTTTTPAPTTTTSPAPPREEVVVVLNPGHNGGNAASPDVINAQVPAGGGQVKACDTTGTQTNAGYPEHAFTWDVTQRVRAVLAAKGVTVVLTRENDTGVGPCVDERTAIGNRANAAAVVSIHADGSEAAGANGFHVAYPAPALNEAQGEPSARLASVLRDGMVAAGFSPANYIGRDGLDGRDDLAGLNLSERPAVFVECGNMRDAAEAAVLSSEDGKQRYANAIAASILTYVGR